MLYDYSCKKCERVHEEFHGMSEHPVVKCACGGKCIKLISTGVQVMGMAGGRGLYDFVDVNTTGRPVRIHTKRQWKEHLKRHGLNDDVKNDPWTKSDIEGKQQKEQHKKDYQRKDLKEAFKKVRATVPKEKRVARGMKLLREGGKNGR